MMTMRCHKSTAGFLSVVLVSVLAGCAAKLKPAVYLDSGFKPESIGQIVMLPAVDARIDKEVEVNLEDQLRGAAAKVLKGKGYDVVLTSAPSETAELTDDDLRAADTALIKRLGPPAARWVMVVILVDVKTKLVFGSTGNAEVAGFLYDKGNSTLVWRDKGIGQAGQGGLVGMLLKGAMDEMAISGAVNHLLASIPERGH